MSQRAQVSLIFYDQELFEELVLPLKEQKMLNSVIIKCLSAYYYNTEVRNLIENIDETAQEDSSSDMDNIIMNMRNTLAMQSFLADDVKQSVESGMEDIDNILNSVNEKAESTGVVKPTQSEYGNGILMINSSENRENNKAQTTTNFSGEMNILAKAILMLARHSGDKEVEALFSEDVKVEQSSQSEAVVETPTQISNDEVSIEPKVQEVITEPIVEEIEVTIEEPEVVVNGEVAGEKEESTGVEPIIDSTPEPAMVQETEEIVEDEVNNTVKEESLSAVSDMMDFLGSLG